jgi:formylglycine-generating enzyme required for sulfatase activity
MSGNVWEWCSTRWQDEDEKEYPMPYRPDDGREEMSGAWRVYRVVRGGSWANNKDALRCASRYRLGPDYRYGHYGFRVCVSPFSPLDSGRSGL